MIFEPLGKESNHKLFAECNKLIQATASGAKFQSAKNQYREKILAKAF